MFIVKIHYGLGNQLFQYAFGRSLSLNRGIPFSLDLHFYKGHEQDSQHPRVYQLDKFCIQANTASEDVVRSLVQPSTFDRSLIQIENIFRPYYKRRIVYERSLNFDEHMWQVKDNVYLAGYWQDLRYFEKYESVIRSDLKFMTEPKGLNKELLKTISTVESVAIHVRRGDYITDSFHTEYVGVAEMPYYRNATKFLKGKINEARYFVFTDDPEWVKLNFDPGVPYQLIDHNDQVNAFEDLRLMSACKHQVISNSSFGWWGAWLNSNDQKIVVAPNVWRKNGPEMYKPVNWIVM
jgi:hypothetical protein